ncbi:hypothetical protein MPER_04471 [Moniliophthora perniciosa FA553]|nr:hypothetical protein MPER_04471 [Moniliophthora perniciosa FA553]
MATRMATRERHEFPSIWPEGKKCPWARTIYDGGIVPLYVLGWALTKEQYDKIVQDKANFGDAVASAWRTEGYDTSYGLDRRPQYYYIGELHGWVAYIKLNTNNYHKPGWVEAAKKVLKLTESPKWYKFTL